MGDNLAESPYSSVRYVTLQCYLTNVTLGSFRRLSSNENAKCYKPLGRFRYQWVPPPMFQKWEGLDKASDYLQKPEISHNLAESPH